MVKANPFPAGILLSATLFLSVALGSCSRQPEAQGQMPPAVPVQVQPVSSGTLLQTSEFVGVLEAQNRVALRPEVDGQVVQVFVQPGDRVRRGTPIMQLKADQTRAQVGGAIADVAAAQAAKSTAEARLSAALSQRDRAAADVRLQQTEFQRTESLVNEGALSQQALDRVRNARDTAIATLKAAEDEARAAQAAVDQANATLARAQAQRSVASADLQDRRIIAPIDGIVGDISLKVGDYVKSGDLITNIIQNGAFDLNLSIPSERGPELEVGLPVELLDAQNEPLIQGRINFVAPDVNAAQQSILAKARFPNNGSLRDGQFVRVRVIWDSAPGVLVPTTAVTRIAGQPFVFVAETGQASAGGEPQQVARQRPVQLGAIQGNYYQVLAGIRPGEPLIVSGILNLQDGVPIITTGQQTSQRP